MSPLSLAGDLAGWSVSLTPPETVAVVLLGAVTLVVVPLLIDLLKRGGAEVWWWRSLTAALRGARGRYQRSRRQKHRKRVEAGLDKVRELVSRTDYKGSRPMSWPPELKRLWSEAAAELIEGGVDWRVEFPQHGAMVWTGEDVMHVHWPDLTINGRANAQRLDASHGSAEIFARWDLAAETERTTPSGLDGGGSVLCTGAEADDQVTSRARSG